MTDDEIKKAVMFDKILEPTRYVLGFLFDVSMDRVVLILKKKPRWQADKFNGVGGKVESGETADQAMEREFREEVSIGMTHTRWTRFLTMRGTNGRYVVDVFATLAPSIPFTSLSPGPSGTPDEVVYRVNVADVLTKTKIWDWEPMFNVPWLVAMAMCHLRTGTAYCDLVEDSEVNA